MKDSCRLFCRSLTLILVCLIMVSSSGCQKATVEKSFGPVFFPAPPNQPKLQFLTSYSGGDQFEFEKASFLETFVLGAEEVDRGRVGKPYGLAIHDDKIYVCDVGLMDIKVMDIKSNTFTKFPTGKAVQKPTSIVIEEDGTKYISDSTGGTISVWTSENKLKAYYGKELGMRPVDMAIFGNNLYVTDAINQQVVVIDKRNGDLVRRIGKQMTDMENWKPDEFAMITNLGLDDKGQVYVTDKLKGKVDVFSPDGKHLRSYGSPGSTPASLVRPKDVAIDKKGRVWAVDAGPAMAVKVYRADGQMLMRFGFLGNDPGQLYMPAGIVIDYDHVDLFKKYVVKGAKIEFLVLVSNQFGSHKVSVYGFGEFPEKYSQPMVPEEPEDSEPEDK